MPGTLRNGSTSSLSRRDPRGADAVRHAAAPRPHAGEPKLDRELRQRASAPRGRSRVIVRLTARRVGRRRRSAASAAPSGGVSRSAPARSPKCPTARSTRSSRLPGVSGVSLDRRVQGTHGADRRDHRRDLRPGHARLRRHRRRRRHHRLGRRRLARRPRPVARRPLRRLRQLPVVGLRRLRPRHARRRDHRRQRPRLGRPPPRASRRAPRCSSRRCSTPPARATSATSSPRSTTPSPTRTRCTSASSTSRSPPASTSRYTTDPLTLAAKRAVDAGLVVVSAAGNLGQDGGRPAAVRRDRRARQRAVGDHGRRVEPQRHRRSQRRHRRRRSARAARPRIDFQAKPDLVAPGVGIESLAEPGSTLFNTKPLMRLWGTVPTANEPYLSLSGTSMAVAGRQRHDRADAAGQPRADAEPGEGDPAVHRGVARRLQRADAGRRLPQRARRGGARAVARGRRQPVGAPMAGPASPTRRRGAAT